MLCQAWSRWPACRHKGHSVLCVALLPDRFDEAGAICGIQHLRNSLPYRRRLTGFVQPRLATLVEERRGGVPKDIAREKNHPCTHGGVAQLQQRIEGLSVHLRHDEVTQD